MAKVKYYAKENSTIGTHSFYVRCKREDVRGLTGVGSLVFFEHELHELTRIYKEL